MERSNLEKYYLSMTPIKSMFEKGIISKQEYQKAESYLADKYCIKKGNLYRLNNLTMHRKRVIYMIPEEEVKKSEENNNQARRVTEVSKEN